MIEQMKTGAPAPMSIRVQRLEEQFGEEPSLLGRPGSGMLAKLATIERKQDLHGAKLDELVEHVTQRRAIGVFLLKVAAVPVVGGLVAWLLHWLSGLPR